MGSRRDYAKAWCIGIEAQEQIVPQEGTILPELSWERCSSPLTLCMAVSKWHNVALWFQRNSSKREARKCCLHESAASQPKKVAVSEVRIASINLSLVLPLDPNDNNITITIISCFSACH